MPIIGAAIAGAAGLTGAAAAVAGSLINIGIAVGLAYVSRALSSSATSTSDTGIKTTIEPGGESKDLRGCSCGVAVQEH
ncbi:hypothetical protein [Xanthobacter autotrophicus]|uniref:hypothetical protein n=1 Tax=Xanthobacter autotrophicus TaxID=280 RepID=UPI0037273DF2